MKNKILLLSFLMILLIPFGVNALSSDYVNKVYEIAGEEQSEGKIDIYFFYGKGCPHCEDEEENLLNLLDERYKDKYVLHKYETWHDDDNLELMKKVKKALNLSASQSVPFTVIGERYWNGYTESFGEEMEASIQEYFEIISHEDYLAKRQTTNIPFLGNIDKKDVSVFLVAIILGFVDGFNPCAMWILLFLINMLIGMKDKKKMLIIGSAFLLTSGLVYFLIMLGISNVLSFLSTSIVRLIIGIIALLVGTYNVYKFIKTRKEDTGCEVVDEKKRKTILKMIKKITNSEKMIIALVSVVILALLVNVLELACSSAFPAVFSEILAVNEITGIPRILYLLLYTFFYMIDDFIVFVIAVATLELSTTSTKYGKYSKIVGGIIMILVGLLLILKPEILMLNF
jgi:cytochrome c biogenesis protein CcdA